MSIKQFREQLLREIPTLGAAVGVWLLPNAPQPWIKSALTVAIVIIRLLLEMLGRRAPRIWRALSLLAAPADANTTKPLNVVVVHDATTEIAEMIKAHHEVDEIQPTTALMVLDDTSATTDSATPKTLLPSHQARRDRDQGRSANDRTCFGRTTVKWRRSSVAMTSMPSLSASATTEASTVPSGRS
jgi:hypothetical protein